MLFVRNDTLIACNHPLTSVIDNDAHALAVVPHINARTSRGWLTPENGDG